MATSIDYRKELKEIEAKMKAAAVFAEKLPIFADKIMENRFDGSEEWVEYANRYKDIPLAWGVNRGFYSPDNRRDITNRKGEYTGYLFNIYVNSINLYDLHEDFNLYESLKGVDIFFTDTSNSTFYVIDENIEPFLEALNVWYLKAGKEARIVKLQEALKNAQGDVRRYKEQLESAQS